MGFSEDKIIYSELASAIKVCDIENFNQIFGSSVINLKYQYCASLGAPSDLMAYLTVMLKAKNKDSYTQSLFVDVLWESYKRKGVQSKLLEDVALDLLPLLFLRERNPENFKAQAKLFMKALSQEPYDVFLEKLPQLVGLIQNPNFNDPDFIVSLLKHYKGAFNFIGHLKVHDQCYYQKDILVGVLSYLKKSSAKHSSVEALYKACNNLSCRSVSCSTGKLDICWVRYSPNEVQVNLEDLLMLKLGIKEEYRDFIPLLVAAKHYKDLVSKYDKLFVNYQQFIKQRIEELYEDYGRTDSFFQMLRKINIPSEIYYIVETEHEIRKAINSNILFDCEFEKVLELGSRSNKSN